MLEFGPSFLLRFDEEDDDMSEATYLNSFLIISSQKNCIQSFSGYVLLKKLDLIILVVMLVEVVLVRGKECVYKPLCCDEIRPPCRRIEWL